MTVVVKPAEQQNRSRVSKIGYRTLTLAREDVDEEARTIRFSGSSETPVQRWWGNEILDHKRTSVRLDRMRSGGPFLVNHDTDDLVAVVEDVQIKEKRTQVMVRFGKSARAEEIFRDMADGIRPGISLRYIIHNMVLEKKSDDGNTYRADDWEPLEYSTVAIPADISVGVGRNQDESEGFIDIESMSRELESEKGDVEMPDQIQQQPGDSGRDTGVSATVVSEARKESAHEERARAKKIRDAARQWHDKAPSLEIEKLGETCVDEGRSWEEFRDKLFERLSEGESPLFKPVAQDAKMRQIGMDKKEVRSFSFTRLVNSLAQPGNSRLYDMAKLEHESCAEWAKRSGRESESGVYLPPDILYGRNFIDMNGLNEEVLRKLQQLEAFRAPITAGTGASPAEGDDLKPTYHDAASFITLLRATTPVTGAAFMMTGLTGDVHIPRHATGAVAGFVTEIQATSETVPTFDHIKLSPNRLGAWLEYSRRSNIQFLPALENLLRLDLLTAIAQKIEQVSIKGGGTSEPDGILQISGTGSVSASSSNVEWATVVDLETEVAADNALMGVLRYLTNTRVRGQMKKEEIATSTAQFIWDRQTPANPVNGYPCMVTNNVPSDLGGGTESALIFGNWTDLIIAVWDTLEMIVNPFSKDTEGVIRISVQHEVDMKVRHPESFAVCADIEA